MVNGYQTKTIRQKNCQRVVGTGEKGGQGNGREGERIGRRHVDHSDKVIWRRSERQNACDVSHDLQARWKRIWKRP